MSISLLSCNDKLDKSLPDDVTPGIRMLAAISTTEDVVICEKGTDSGNPPLIPPAPELQTGITVQLLDTSLSTPVPIQLLEGDNFHFITPPSNSIELEFTLLQDSQTGALLPFYTTTLDVGSGTVNELLRFDLQRSQVPDFSTWFPTDPIDGAVFEPLLVSAPSSTITSPEDITIQTPSRICDLPGIDDTDDADDTAGIVAFDDVMFDPDTPGSNDMLLEWVPSNTSTRFQIAYQAACGVLTAGDEFDSSVPEDALADSAGMYTLNMDEVLQDLFAPETEFCSVALRLVRTVESTAQDIDPALEGESALQATITRDMLFTAKFPSCCTE